MEYWNSGVVLVMKVLYKIIEGLMRVTGIILISIGILTLYLFFWFRRYNKYVDKSRKIFSYIADAKMIIGGVTLIILGLIAILK